MESGPRVIGRARAEGLEKDVSAVRSVTRLSTKGVGALATTKTSAEDDAVVSTTSLYAGGRVAA